MGDEYNKRGEWEEAWQQAFEDYPDQTPPPKIWQGLENTLMEQQLHNYKRKLFLYQRLAVASVVLLALWVGWWAFLTQPTEQQLASGTTNTREIAQTVANNPFANILAASNDIQAQAGTTASFSESRNPGSAREIAPQHDLSGSFLYSKDYSNGLGFYGPINALQLNAAHQRQIGLIQNALVLAILSHQEQLQQQQLAGVGNVNTEEFYMIPAPQASSLPAVLELQDGKKTLPPRYVFTARAKEAKKRMPNGNTWLGVSVASSYFNPNLSGSGDAALAWVDQPKSGKGGDQVYTANTSSWDEKQKSLPSIDISIDAAFRLGTRWMFQSSLQYGTYKVNSLSGTFSSPDGNNIYPLYYSNFSYDKLQTVNASSRKAQPVEAINSFTFMSVPLTLTYVLTERTVGLGVTAGVSSDVFMGGRIGDAERRLDEYTIEAGKNSPFNRVHFNALLGAQLFYRAGPNYIITLEPTYRHSISDFSKENSLFESRPTGFGVAAGFRFILP